jgi:hypothetical protein
MLNYKLDPAWYYTASGLSWDSVLKSTEVELELLNDIHMLRMFQKGIRGGISMTSNRYVKAINKYMGDKYDPIKPSFIPYFDKTIFYGWAMSQLLLTSESQLSQ